LRSPRVDMGHPRERLGVDSTRQEHAGQRRGQRHHRKQ
jgi:hypothetical protein